MDSIISPNNEKVKMVSKILKSAKERKYSGLYVIEGARIAQELPFEYNLDTTDGSLDGDNDDENYDEYHDCYTYNDTVTVLYDGREMSCDEDRLDDFVFCEEADMYVYAPNTDHCEICGNNYIKDEGVYSELTDEYYCCKDCKETAEKEFKEEQPNFQEKNQI